MSNDNINESGISVDSKQSMREFLLAVLVDNPNGERENGLIDTDIMELYEQAIEVIRF